MTSDFLKQGLKRQGVDELAAVGKMAERKEQLTEQVTGAIGEIEQLRKKQEQLEKEKGTLEECAKKQEEYEKGKVDIIEKISGSMVVLDKEEEHATNMCELLAETKVRFTRILEELEEIDEDGWSDHNFEVELNRALVRVDIAKADYKKAMARIEASSWHKGVTLSATSEIVPQSVGQTVARPGFLYWLKVGFAVTLPLALVMVILFAVYLRVFGRL